ncbi:MAG: hypothetical protein WCL04_00995 [Verrucomicrobiota bacterium]
MLCPAAEPAAAPPASATPPASAQVYEDKAKGFAFDVPAGWTVSKSGDALLVNNQRPGLNLTYWNPGGGAGAGPIRAPDKPPEEILQLLRPGEIWLKLTSSPGTNHVPDSAVSEINARLARPVAPTANPDLFRLSFTFYKHGHWFDCIAFLRSPVSDVEKGKLLTMLQNLRFMDKPVSNVTWAASLAGQSLPAAVRDIKEPLAQHPPYARPPPTVAWITQPLEDAYSVTVTLNTVPPGLGAAYKAGDTWKFRVSFDGIVTLQSGSADSAPAAPPAEAAPAAAKPGN